jgi:hypothetical protein
MFLGESPVEITRQVGRRVFEGFSLVQHSVLTRFRSDFAPGIFFWVWIPTLAGSQLPGQLLFTAVTGSVTVAAAVLSWHFYEARFLKWKALFH